MKPWDKKEYENRNLYVQGAVELKDFISTHQNRIYEIFYLLQDTKLLDWEVVNRLTNEHVRWLQCKSRDNIFEPAFASSGKPGLVNLDAYPRVLFDSPTEDFRYEALVAKVAYTNRDWTGKLFDMYLLDSRCVKAAERLIDECTACSFSREKYPIGYIIMDIAPVCESSKELANELNTLARKYDKEEHLYAETPLEVL